MVILILGVDDDGNVVGVNEEKFVFSLTFWEENENERPLNDKINENVNILKTTEYQSKMKG